MNPRLKAQPRSLEDEALWRNSLSRPGSRPHCWFRPNEQHLLIANEMPGASVAVALDDATVAIRDRQDIAAVAISFLWLRSNLRRRMRNGQAGKEGLWIVAALFCLYNAFQSRIVWLNYSRFCAEMKRALVPNEAARAMSRVVVV